jgi:hypothetical protein
VQRKSIARPHKPDLRCAFLLPPLAGCAWISVYWEGNNHEIVGTAVGKLGARSDRVRNHNLHCSAARCAQARNSLVEWGLNIRMKPYPAHRQREALQVLMVGGWMPLLKLIPIGDRLLAGLLQTGWIERSPDANTRDLYRITEAGRTAFRTPVPIR